MAKRAALRKPLELVKPALPIKLDIGCGMRKQPGFEGVDVIPFAGVDHVLDIRQRPWKWAPESVSEIHASHFLEHLTAWERVAFVNEAYRVLVPGGKIQFVVPHWASCRAYGDPTHVWPPVSEFWGFYLSQDWRDREAPHTDIKHEPKGFSCNFAAQWGYGLKPELLVRAKEYQQHALENFKEAAADLYLALTKA